MADGDARPTITLAALTDPLDPKSWSGTPANIAAALRRAGRHVDGVVAGPPASVGMRARAVLSWAGYGFRGDARQMPLARLSRRAQAARVQANLRAARSTHVLHMGGDRYLPLTRTDAGVRHYLLIDSTWHTWRQNWTVGDKLPARYVAQREAAARAAFAQADHIFPLAEYVRDDLIHHYGVDPAKVTVVGTGLGTIRPYHGPKDYANGTILFAARSRWTDKGGDLVTAAFEIAHRSNPNLKLWVVGDDSVKPLQDRLPNTTVHGYLSQGQLQDLFDRASLFAMPSPQEPWGLVYLEAMACRMPVLGLRVKAVPEFTGHGRHGFAVWPPTPEAVAGAMVAALSDPDALDRMGTEAQRYCLERYTWDHVANAILAVVDGRPAVRP